MKSPPFPPVICAACLAVATLLFSAPALRAEIVMLNAPKDNTLFQDPTESLSNGAGSWFFSGRTLQTPGYDLRRGLIAFDLATIAPGSIINSVSLRLYMDRSLFEDSEVSLHTLLRDWGEGTSDAPGKEGAGIFASSGDATWIHNFYDSSTWTTPGGDFNPLASGVQSVGIDTDFYTWSSTGMTADVQSWLDNPSSNFGWLVKGDESGAPTAKRYASAQNPDTSFRPLLTIDYSPAAAPEPSRPILLLTAALAITLRRRRAC